MRVIAVLALLAAVLLAACSSGPIGGEGPPSAASAASAGAVAPEYRLGPGDKVRVIVFGETSLSGEFLVSGSGQVAFPLVGDVQAQGLTLGEFQTAVQTALREGYVKEPRVSAEVLNYRPFYILGEVNRPGEYPYTAGLTVLNAVATANGFTYRADTRRVYIRKSGETGERQAPLTATTLVSPGDTIRIGERFF